MVICAAVGPALAQMSSYMRSVELPYAFFARDVLVVAEVEARFTLAGAALAGVSSAFAGLALALGFALEALTLAGFGGL